MFEKNEYNTLRDIASSGLGRNHKVTLLNRLAVKSRDCDNIEEFESCVKFLKEDCMAQFNPPNSSILSWAAMYSNENNSPRILVLKEKYDTRYIDASTPDKFALTCLDVLAERLENGCYEPQQTTIPPFREVPQYYLGSVLQKELPDMTGENKEIYNRIKNSPVFKQIKDNVEIADIHAKLYLEINNTPVNEQTVSLLALLMLYSHPKELLSTLNGKYDNFPFLTSLLKNISPCIHDEALETLRYSTSSHPTALREAGREAYELLMSRNNHEYEGIDLIDVEAVNNSRMERFKPSDAENNIAPTL